MKKVNSTILLCIVFIFLLASCGKNAEATLIEINQDIQGSYILEELDISQIGIGNPGGTCIYNNYIYVCDTENHCIVKLSKDLEMLESYGTLGMEYGNFSKPMDITFSGNCFYVLDSGNNRVQKFSADFGYQETYNLEHLVTEQGSGLYVSIAVDREGIIYVSTIAPDTNDGHIFYWDNDTWNQLGENVVGYLCEGGGKVYFANIQEFQIEKDRTIIQSGKNLLYEIDSKELKPICRFMDKYAPAALTYWNDRIYMISAGRCFVNYFTDESEMLETVVALSETSTHMYMCIDDDGNMYITNNGTGRFYRAIQ
ncbi:MAG: hypothetical protein J1E83_05195 [Lachnospiraceae bacterium]|nr:hypothetical protein [Lachnospiraceae bacterium]